MRQFLHRLLTQTRALALVAIIVSVCQQAWAQVDPGLSYSAAEATATIDGNGVSLTAPSLSNPLGVAVTYSSSNEAVAAINNSGNVTVIEAGQTTISARATDENTYLQTPASYVLTVKRDISGATITLAETSLTYDGTAKTPAVSSVTLGGLTLDDAYYSVSYSNNVDVAAADAAAAPTVTVTGSFIYFGSVSTTFSINKGTAGLAFAQDAVSMTLGEDWTQPVLSNPHQLAVSYSSSDTGVATVSATGTVTVLAAGTTTISAAFAGNDNYEAQTVSYSLTVAQPDPVTPDPPVKGSADLAFSASTAQAVLGQSWTQPTLTNPHGLSVSYSSSDTNVATISATGTVTVLAAGTTTISAAFAGNDDYEAQTVSYRLTVTKPAKATADLRYSASRVETELGEEWEQPELKNPHRLSVSYRSSDSGVATVDQSGKVTVKALGQTTISAAFAGNDDYEAQTVSYQLVVKRSYSLWVGGTQVSTLNYTDVLDNGAFFYDDASKTLVVTDNTKAVNVESQMPELNMYLNGESKLGQLFFNNQGDKSNTGTLRITSWDNVPGKLTLASNMKGGVLSGFSDVSFDRSALTFLLNPEDGVYKDSLLRSKLGSIAYSALIGQYVKPIVDLQPVTFPATKYTGADLRNTVIDNVLFTLLQHEEDTDEDDDYYDATDEAVVLNTVNSQADMKRLAEAVEKGDLLPGTARYAEQFKGGLTFMVPGGDGTIELKLQNEPGYAFQVMVGNSEPQIITQTERSVVTIPYEVDHAEYVYLYMTKANGTRIGKREKVHGKVYELTVLPRHCNVCPLFLMAGYPQSQIPQVTLTTADTTGIEEPLTDDGPALDSDGHWYDLQGRRIDRPTKPGLYIHNHRKIVVR